jgi:hypothetical protein
MALAFLYSKSVLFKTFSGVSQPEIKSRKQKAKGKRAILKNDWLRLAMLLWNVNPKREGCFIKRLANIDF